jgi:hypothetical protein
MTYVALLGGVQSPRQSCSFLALLSLEDAVWTVTWGIMTPSVQGLSCWLSDGPCDLLWPMGY